MSTPDPAPLIYLPTPTDVARLLRARTKDSHGAELGDWSDDTRPTPEEVADLIDQAAGPVLARVGRLEAPVGEPNPYADLVPAAHHLVTLGAAMLVEKSYFPEQVASDRSAYTSYQAEYQDCLAALVGDGDGSGGGPLPSGGGDHATWPLPSATVLYAYGGYWDTWPEPENAANWRTPFQPPREPPLAGDLPVGDAPASGRRLR
jgi:hypothetical protein